MNINDQINNIQKQTILMNKISKVFRFLEKNYGYVCEMDFDGSIEDLISINPESQGYVFISYFEVGLIDPNKGLVVFHYFSSKVEYNLLETLKRYELNYEGIGQNQIRIR